MLHPTNEYFQFKAINLLCGGPSIDTKVKQEDFSGFISFYCRSYLCWVTKPKQRVVETSSWLYHGEQRRDRAWFDVTIFEKKSEILGSWFYTEQSNHWGLLS